MDDGRPLQVRVLGPIEVRDHAGRDVTPDGALQRRLLALLVLHRDSVVTVDSAIDALWTDGAPRDPVAALQTHLFRLRRAVPDLAVRSAEAGGYCLVGSSVVLDADRLEAALRGVVAGDPAAVADLDGLLPTWVGPAYPELADTDAGRAEAARLDELRMEALERRAEARLGAGSTDGLVAELATLVDAAPLRERPRRLLIEALAANGRVGEALRVYDDYRRALGGEMGIEPSPELTARRDELLRGDGGFPWRPPTVLPVPLSSLIGRDALLDRCCRMVAEHRLVSLVGPGGVGKTRLLLEVGQRIRAAEPDRSVVFCELASATPPTVVDAVAAALAIEGRPGEGFGQRLPALLVDAELTLLLDNCEHVVDAAAELVERMLAAGSDVRVVATSRERLRVPGEQVCPVPPLSTTGGDDAAEGLFVARAAAIDPTFAPSESDRATIREIVRHLDGLPLAIELAAARLRTIDLEDVAVGLDQRFELLDAGPRTNPRHRSLHAAVSWSVDALGPELREVFCSLSVFTTPFTLDDAAAVCAGAPVDVARGLDALVERSLVERAAGRRYALLETIRAFGAEQLALAGTAPSVRERHARHVVEWLERTDRGMDDVGNEDALLAIDRALPEVRAALRWLLERGDVDPAGRLVVALDEYGWLRMRTDVLAWAELVAEADPDDEGSHAPLVWTAAAIAAWLGGDVAEATRRGDRARQIAQRRGTPSGRVSHWQGTAALLSGRLADAVRHYRTAQTELGDDRGRRLSALGTEVLALAYGGLAEDAEQLANEMLEEIGELRGPHAAFCWYCAGEADLNGDLERARERFGRALEIAEATGTAFVSGVAGTSDASVEVRRGRHREAARLFRSLLVHWRRAGVWSTQWTTLRSVALVLEGLGQLREAAMLAAAALATDQGHRVFGADEVALFALQDRLRASLGDDAHRDAVAEGQQLDGDAAVELALRSL